MTETLEELVKNATQTFNYLGRAANCKYCGETIWWVGKQYGKDGIIKNIAIGQSFAKHNTECKDLPQHYRPRPKDYTKDQ